MIRQGDVGPDRLNDQEVAHLVERTAIAAGAGGCPAEVERGLKFSGHSLRSGLASSAQVDERYVQKQLGHVSAEMTRKYRADATASTPILQRRRGLRAPSPAPGVKSLGQNLGLGFQLSAAIEIGK